MAKSVISDGKNVLKNILLAVTTTVLGTSVLYFLGLKDKSKLTAVEKEEITAETWKSYATIENIHLKKTVSLLQDALEYGKYDEIKTQSEAGEADFNTSIGEFIETDGVDKELVALLKERVKTEKKITALEQALYAGYEMMNRKSVTESWALQRTKDSALNRTDDFMKEWKKALEAPAVAIENLSARFSEKYTQPFETDDFVLLKARRYGDNALFDLSTETKKEAPPVVAAGSGGKNIGAAGDPATVDIKYLLGEWNQDGNTIRFYKNGAISWLDKDTDKLLTGKWQLKKERLYITLKKNPVPAENGTEEFIVSDVYSNSFTMQLATLTKEFYHLERM